MPLFPPYICTGQYTCSWTNMLKLSVGLGQSRSAFVSCVLWHNLSFNFSSFPFMLCFMKLNDSQEKGERVAISCENWHNIGQPAEFWIVSPVSQAACSREPASVPQEKVGQHGWYRNESMTTCMFPFLLIALFIGWGKTQFKHFQL